MPNTSKMPRAKTIIKCLAFLMLLHPRIFCTTLQTWSMPYFQSQKLIHINISIATQHTTQKLYSTLTMANFRGKFSLIEARPTRLAHKASKWHPQEGGTPAGRLLRSKSAERAQRKAAEI